MDLDYVGGWLDIVSRQLEFSEIMHGRQRTFYCVMKLGVFEIEIHNVNEKSEVDSVLRLSV